MLVQTNTYLKCGVRGISHLHTRNHHLSSKSTCRLSSSVAPRSSELTALGSRFTAMSSQVLGKTKADVVHNDGLQGLLDKSSYEAAMEALSSLITRQKRGDKSFVGGKYDKLERMAIYLEILGLKEKISGLKVIHVAGTKGKGSTCAFCEAILRECGFRTGLFTSPHLIDVRERFRIDGLDISEEKFLLYFWDCWNQLKANVSDDLPMPPLFQFLTILAFRMFICEQVDVAIIEVGLGGKRDSTNVIEDPVVCGITSLGMDHMEALGNSLEEIAAHKAGIFKPQIPAFSVPQLPEAMKVLEEIACGLKVPLEVATPLDNERYEGLKLGLSGDHQFVNAGLAISLCKSWLERTGNGILLGKDSDKSDKGLPEAFLRGLATARLSGRAQIVVDIPFYRSTNMLRNASGELIFYLDGAHSPESMDACARWFSNSVRGKITSLSLSAQGSPSKFLSMNLNYGNGYICEDEEDSGESANTLKQILLFNCMDVRDPWALLPPLVNTCASSGTHLSKALFVPSMSTYNRVTSGALVIPPDISTKDLSWQFNLQKIWEKIIYGQDVLLEKCVKTQHTGPLPPREFLYEDVSRCNPADRYYACSAVIPTLPMAIKWLRDCVKENPSLRLQVLVTGSLHLVGDVLKLLRS